MKGILGKKIGMTQVFDEDGRIIPVTVIEAEPNLVSQIKTEETDGYNAVQLAVGEKREKLTTKSLQGHFKKAGIANKRYLREFRVDNPEDYNLADEITVDLFEPGDRVDVTGISKGKGTQGAIVRHNYSIGRKSHGSKYHRGSGARSASAFPGRVFKGREGSGKTGNERVTVQNLEIVRVDADRNLILLKGAVPGNKGGLVTIKETVKSR